MSHQEKKFDSIGLITREDAIAAAQNAVRDQGYAVAVHGSRVRDLDLIAIPWIDNCAVTALGIAEIIAESIPALLQSKQPEKKSHGRLSFVLEPKIIWGFDIWYIDLSVMPRKRSKKSQ